MHKPFPGKSLAVLLTRCYKLPFHNPSEARGKSLAVLLTRCYKLSLLCWVWIVILAKKKAVEAGILQPASNICDISKAKRFYVRALLVGFDELPAGLHNLFKESWAKKNTW